MRDNSEKQRKQFLGRQKKGTKTLLIRLRLRCYAVLTQHSTYFIIKKKVKKLIDKISGQGEARGVRGNILDIA